MEELNKFKDSIEPVGIEDTRKLLAQLMNCICKIKIKGEFGTGFFCEVPVRKEIIKVLVTSYHILNENDLKENEILNLALFNDWEAIIIDLKIKREIYFNKEYDITLIELNKNDKISDYLELDDNLFLDNIEINYKSKSVYILHYLKGKEAKISYGLLNDIDKSNIIHNCRTDKGSLGAPIINLKSKKVIGIHNKISNNYNIGTLLKFALKDFINKMEKMFININNTDYKIIKELVKDESGKIYQVLKNNKYYAIKVIPIKAQTKEKIKSFEKEVEILSKFNCDNIVKYYEYSKDNNNIYILMEYCDGDNLRSLINKHINDNTLIEENILINIIIKLCTGIKEIHAKKIIHKNLKPENIFINENMNIKIGDFGISKQLDSLMTLITNDKYESIDYIAPEILYKKTYNYKSDIYSLGCIIYELFTLNIYNKDNSFHEIKKLNTNIYNNKWQILIDSLLQANYKKRFDINQVYQFLENELIINFNTIIGEIYIEKENVGEIFKIINSFENAKREMGWKDRDDDWKYENEKEIKENIEIKINGKIIEFSYYYKFNKEGKNIVEYSFKNKLTKTCYMFYDCKSLKNLNFSIFNAQNVTNTNNMFYNCRPLTNLDLSNFNTQNVTDMSGMFYYCESLKNLNLSNFNTQNVIYMEDIFYFCISLKKANIATKDNKILNIIKN